MDTPDPLWHEERLNRIAERMTQAMEGHPEYLDGADRVIVLLMHKDMEGVDHGGIQLAGHIDDRDALADIFIHARALCRHLGIRFDLLTQDEDDVPDHPERN